ncbi:MAG: disulfide bond formation protein B [Planctomycetaceae bacterium]|nr:disulfide bond formation protein B [Planctomycetaceae bacterium]
MNPDTNSITSSRRSFATATGWIALGVATMGSVGSVYLSIGLGLKACPLCFYQRSFMMAAAISLLVSFWLDGVRSFRLCLVALPFAAAGLGVAMFHEYLVLSGKLECPPAVFGWGDGPIQSLAAFSVLTAVCLMGAFLNRHSSERQGLPSIIASILVGVGVAWACIASAPSLPPTPAQPYDAVKQPFDMCRPPFVKASN